MWQETQGSLRRGIPWTMHVVVAVSLVSGIVGILVSMKFYILQAIFAGLLSVAILFTAGVLLLVVFVSLREVWRFCLDWAKRGFESMNSADARRLVL
jgi:hypothetical protein